jgi:hypothetical protein
LADAADMPVAANVASKIRAAKPVRPVFPAESLAVGSEP